jgi:hypothetical protein
MGKLDDPNNPDPGGDPLDGGPGAPPITPDNDAPAQNTELQEWRRRALEAEALVDQLSAEIDALRAQLETTSRTHEVRALLERAGALDVDAARAVLDARLADAPSGEPVDLSAAVDDLKRALPFLFVASELPAPAPVSRTRSAMSAAPEPSARAFDDLDAALELASTTGDRAALLRYLRLRRAV